MTTEEFDFKLDELGLSRASFSQKVNLSKSTVDSWINKESFPLWLNSWLEIKKENIILKQSIESKNTTIKELSSLLAGSSIVEQLNEPTKKRITNEILICKYVYSKDIDSIEDLYKVEITKKSGSRTYCRWLYNDEEGSLSSIAGEIQKHRNPDNQSPSINGNDYFVNKDGILYKDILKGKVQ